MVFFIKCVQNYGSRCVEGGWISLVRWVKLPFFQSGSALPLPSIYTVDLSRDTGAQPLLLILPQQIRQRSAQTDNRFNTGDRIKKGKETD
jgi:hypothetical protein